MRQGIAKLLALFALAVGPAAIAATPAYPDKPVTVVVGYPPGGATDIVARLILTEMQARLHRPFVIKNQPGANSAIASEAVTRAAPDGYTLLLGTIANAINATLMKENIHYDTERAFIPVVQFQSSPSILVVNPKVPVKTLAEFIALAKANPGMAYASSGSGSSPHLAGELLKQRAAIDLLHVAYKGAAPAMTDVMAGHVQAAFVTAVTAIPNIHSGALRPLAVAAGKRLPELPDVPTMAEAGMPNFEVQSWNWLFAPAGTPLEVITTLNRAVNETLKQPDIRARIEDMSSFPAGGTPEQFRALLHDEIRLWGDVIRKGGIRPE
jgi:tripartite-type tricarboxylate transporter receptor subunit TctC